jgi:hypothetical protein
MGKSTISMAIFNSFLYVYQRVQSLQYRSSMYSRHCYGPRYGRAWMLQVRQAWIHETVQIEVGKSRLNSDVLYHIHYIQHHWNWNCSMLFWGGLLDRFGLISSLGGMSGDSRQEFSDHRRAAERLTSRNQYPPVNIQKAIEHCHWNSGFTMIYPSKMVIFHRFLYVYQRVLSLSTVYFRWSATDWLPPNLLIFIFAAMPLPRCCRSCCPSRNQKRSPI